MVAETQQLPVKSSREWHFGTGCWVSCHDPLLFVIVMAVITGITLTLLSMLGLGMAGAMAVGLSAMITCPVSALIGSFIGATVMFLIWRLMGSEETYETAYRCVAYAAAIQI